MATKKSARKSAGPLAVRKLGIALDRLAAKAESTVVVLQVEVVGKPEAIRFWLMPETTSAEPRPFPIHPESLKGTETLSVGVTYFLFCQFLGNPGDGVKYVVTANDKPVLKAERKVAKKAIVGFVREFKV